MDFFSSFHALGYSAINIVLIFVVAMAVIFRSVGMHTKSAKHQIIALAVLMIIFAAPFVMTVNFLASENLRLNDAVRSDGGIKQNFPDN